MAPLAILGGNSVQEVMSKLLDGTGLESLVSVDRLSLGKGSGGNGHATKEVNAEVRT